MKKLMLSGLLSLLFLSITSAQYDDVYYGESRTGYEGDYFSLEGALDLFKQSYSLRDFERKLNTEENWVNNLDLNYDGRIDYIRVEHRQQGRYHAIILQALLDRYDVQDVAVIEMEVIGRRDAILQIIGDEDLYGEEVVVEPIEGYSNNRRGYHSDYGNYINVYYWDPVQHILDQQYYAYVSPYRWQYYPTWWSPWRQCAWNVYRPRVVVYHRHYHVVHRHRVVHVHNFYRTHRVYSHTVVQHANKVRIKQGKAPIQRPVPVVKQDRSYDEQQRNNRVVEQPRSSTGSRTARTNPSVSRNNPTTSRPDPRSRSSVDSPRTSRTATPERSSSVNSRKATPPSDQNVNRRPAPQTRQPARSTTTYDRNATRSTPSRERSAVNSRTAPSAKPGNSRAPSSVQQPSRSKPTGSSATTRSRTTTSRPSVRNERSAPASKPNVTKSAPSKGNDSKGSSRSRGGK